MGYYRAGFDVTGVDLDPKRAAEYPFEVIVGDALELAWTMGGQFDAVHLSPPCTGYTRGTAALPDRLERYDRLIGVAREIARALGVPYVIENVADAAPELESPMMLCWSMFHTPGSVIDTDGTPLTMRRHRLFESNIALTPPASCNHPRHVQVAGAYGGARRDKVEAREVRKGGYVPATLDVLRELMGTPWLSEKGVFLAVPPSYTEHIGKQLIEHIEREAA